MNSNKSMYASRAAPFRAVATSQKSPNSYPRTGRCGSSSRSTASAGMRGTRGNALISSIALLLLWAALILGAIWGAVNVAGNLFAMPYVHTSHLTGECVAVIAPDGTKLGCENKPERYHHVWVE